MFMHNLVSRARIGTVLSWAQPKSIAGVLSSHGEADKVAEPAKKP